MIINKDEPWSICSLCEHNEWIINSAWILRQYEGHASFLNYSIQNPTITDLLVITVALRSPKQDFYQLLSASFLIPL